jgi:tetratricopeptide (TPR) repeat protein
LYAQADVHLQWAFVKSQNGDYLSAALDFRSAFQLLEKNASLYPSFVLNNKDLGILKVIIGTIPDGYKWIASIVGLSGNYEEGMGMIRKFIASNTNVHQLSIELQSAKILYCLLQVNFEKNKVSNWKLTDKYTSDYETNLMSACIRAFVAHKCDMTDEGIRNLLAKPYTKEYVNFYYTDYLLGSMKLTRLDDDAAFYLKKFVSLCPNKSLYEESYTKLAWTYILKADTELLFICRLVKKIQRKR